MKKRSRKKTRLFLTDRSLRDLAEVEQYSLQQWGRKKASQYISQVETSLSLIVSQPNLLQPIDDFPPCLQYYRINKHVLIFDVQTCDITLLTLFHTSMDLPTRLAEMQPQLLLEVDLLHRRLEEK